MADTRLYTRTTLAEVPGLQDQLDQLQTQINILKSQVAAIPASPTVAQFNTLQSQVDALPTTAVLNTLLTSKSDKSRFAAVAALAAHGVTTAPTDAKTDYNVVTTLLGTLVDGLNTTNTKQNQIASKLNSVMTWLDTNKDKINATITAGKT